MDGLSCGRSGEELKRELERRAARVWFVASRKEHPSDNEDTRVF